MNKSDPMVLIFDTAVSPGTTIAFFLAAYDMPLDAVIDWGDGNMTPAYHTHDEPERFSHTYTVDGTYTVTITGTVPTFGGDILPETCDIDHHNKLVAVRSFGDVGLVSLDHAFSEAHHLTSVPPNLPSTVHILSGMFATEEDMDGQCRSVFDDPNITNWDTSNVTSMSFMFAGCVNFNQPIGLWDTSNVVDMVGMFSDAKNFNQPLGGWETSNVTNMDLMFNGATNFNQPLNSWDTSNLTDVAGMFAEATNFNQPLNSWDTSNVDNMESMFRGATSFNQPLNSWDTSNVVSMYEMFSGATSFNQPLDTWDTSNITDMSFMFKSATEFNHSIGMWDTSNVTDISFMFFDAKRFNQPLDGWTLSSLISADYLLNHTSMTTDTLSRTLEGWATGLMATLTTSPDVTLVIPFPFEQLTEAGQQAVHDLTRHNDWLVISPT